MVARIPVVDPSELSSSDRQALEALPNLALFRTLAHAPTVITPWLGLGAALLAATELSGRRRELAVLTVAHEAGCRYEWVQHEVIAQASGVSLTELSAIANGTADTLFAPADATVVRVATEAVRSIQVSPEAIAAAREWLGDRQTVELLCLIGYYLATAVFSLSTDLDIDEPAGSVVVDASSDFMDQ